MGSHTVGPEEIDGLLVPPDTDYWLAAQVGVCQGRVVEVRPPTQNGDHKYQRTNGPVTAHLRSAAYTKKHV